MEMKSTIYYSYQLKRIKIIKYKDLYWSIYGFKCGFFINLPYKKKTLKFINKKFMQKNKSKLLFLLQCPNWKIFN